MAGNALRCMAKYLYDNGIVRKEEMTLETDKGTKTVRVYTTDGRVTSACVDMGYATLDTTALRLNIPKRQVVNYPVEIAGQPWEITCVDMGNPTAWCSVPGWTAWMWPGSGRSLNMRLIFRTGSTRSLSGW